MKLWQIKWWLDGVLQGHPDQTSVEELSTIKQIVKKHTHKNMRILEIGSWMGCSSVVLGEIAKQNNGKLACVDSWRGTEVDDLRWISKWRDVFSAFWKRICRTGLSNTIIPMRGASQDVLPLLANGLFDMIYIDGDHRYSGIKHDILQAKRLIRKDGVIAGHDYDVGHPDVMRAVNEIFGKPKHKGRVWWVK